MQSKTKEKFESLSDAKEQKLAASFSGGGLDASMLENFRISRDEAQKVLIVANSNSSDSMALLDYYYLRRPWFYYIANRMQVNCPITEAITTAEYLNLEQQIAAHPKIAQIKYIILLLDIPTRVPEATYLTLWASVSTRLYHKFNKEKYITHLNMGSLEDCRAYVRKLGAIYSATPNSQKSIFISGRKSGLVGNKFWFEDVESKVIYGQHGKSAYVTIMHIDSPYYEKIYKKEPPHLWQCQDVVGYLCWGWNGGMHGNYAVPEPEAHGGKVRFSGKSNWYLIQTIESFNGRREVHQGHFTQWFSHWAFGGTNYSSTPICAVTHVDEPGLFGVNEPTILWKKWIEGEIFAKCAWDSVKSTPIMFVGDPLITI